MVSHQFEDDDLTAAQLMTKDEDDTGQARSFQVHLDVFEGPFDLLLALISKHKLDITEVALSQVTDEFIAFISQRSDDWDLDQVSYFLVVAATLLDLKAARLLPSGEVEDEEDLALLEARDLLFARLLQYRAYKEVAAIFAARMTAAARRFPRRVPLEPRFAGLLPEVLLGLGPAEFARLAALALTPKPPPVVGRVPLEPRFADLLPEVLLGLGPAEFARLASLALAPKPPPTVDTQHIHAPVISIRDQAAVIATLLRELGRASFRRLTAHAEGSYEVVASFLALLELFREEAVSFQHQGPGRGHRHPAAGARPGQLPAADRPRRRQLRGSGLVPGPARAVPRRGGVLRAGRPAGRALRDMDRVRRHRQHCQPR